MQKSLTATKKRQQQQQVNDDNSIWDFTKHTYHMDNTMQQIPRRLSLLRQACPDYQIQVQIQFESFQTLQKFQKKLQQQHEVYRGEKIVNKNDFMYLWQQIYRKTLSTHRTLYVNKKFYRIAFTHPIQLTIFYQTFSKQLTQLQNEYKYLILPYKKQLKVYLMNQHEEKISSFFTTQLIEMKNLLWMYVEERNEVQQLVRYSKLAQKKLLQQGIQFMILSRSKHVVFYSIIVNPTSKIRAITRKLLSYHISIIKFPQLNIDQYILCELSKLIVRELRPTIKQVNDLYEMPVEIDVEQAVIVVNDLHEVFIDGLRRLEGELWQMKIVQIQCKEMALLRRILLNPMYQEVVKHEVKYRKCFLIFGRPLEGERLKAKHNKLLAQLFREMSDCFVEMYTIVIHMMHLYNNADKLRKETERVLMLAGARGLNVVTYHRVVRMDGFYKIVMEPKELSEYGGRDRALKVIKMLESYVIEEQVMQEQQLFHSDYGLFESPHKIIELLNPQIYNSSQQNRILQSSIQEVSRQITTLLWQDQQQQQYLFSSQRQLSTLLIEQQQSFQSQKKIELSTMTNTSIDEKYPQRRMFEDSRMIYVRGKRSLKVQRKLELKFSRKLKIWRLIINELVDMSNNSNNKNNSNFIAYKQLFLIGLNFIKYHSNRYIKLKSYSQAQHKFIEDLAQGEHAIVCFVNRQKNAFLPMYELEIVE